MISVEDAIYTYEYPGYYKILPSIHNWSLDPARIGNGIRVKDNFTYSSDTNSEWMDIQTLQDWIKQNLNKIGKI